MISRRFARFARLDGVGWPHRFHNRRPVQRPASGPIVCAEVEVGVVQVVRRGWLVTCRDCNDSEDSGVSHRDTGLPRFLGVSFAGRHLVLRSVGLLKVASRPRLYIGGVVRKHRLWTTQVQCGGRATPSSPCLIRFSLPPTSSGIGPAATGREVERASAYHYLALGRRQNAINIASRVNSEALQSYPIQVHRCTQGLASSPGLRLRYVTHRRACQHWYGYRVT
ncbi:uncharacterized protein B0H18DRAFT_657514 [Fomitopsis serialis]|uniref:uncharacterized protein n=1 Tax=Fomitopsis serialis TaxID=139415 RepID=UPI002008AB48|nr:uncharacterized protein B0H18DRAFT_657514 [Neoantrodia serialis]KAH9919022.1 hypothetical protein B0H18DRAFT_657514 [Neoantrodia serialis]